jgi:hypothetical protein
VRVRTCVRYEALQMAPGPLVLQQLLGGQMRQQHLQDGLGVQTAAGVGVPHGAVAQQGLCGAGTGDGYTQIRHSVA